MDSEEEWRSIPGYPHYEASSQGRIRSLARLVASFNRYGQLKRPTSGKILSAPIAADGHTRLVLWEDGHRHGVLVHKIVAMAWLGMADGTFRVYHKNKNKSDNRPENLRCVNKLTEKDVLDIRRRATEGKSLAGMAEEYGLVPQTVGAIVRRETWQRV